VTTPTPTTVTSTVASTTYEIRVDGHLDDHWSHRLGGLALTRADDGTTVLRGAVADQTQLHGLLTGLRDIGATLLEVRAVSARDAGSPVEPALEGPLRTDRLTLRPATADDADATWAFRRLDAVNEWLTGRPADLDAYRAVFTDPARLATTLVVQLGHQRDGQVVGDLMLRREDGWSQREVVERARGTQAELGWVIVPEHSGRGYATEAVRELLRHCFEDLGVRRVVATCFLANEPSWRLMERVGMRRELHAVRESLHRSGEWLDTLGYALLDDEWRAQHAHSRPPKT
jgi:RimJ/RimL family protein N-acetyltransferase